MEISCADSFPPRSHDGLWSKTDHIPVIPSSRQHPMHDPSRRGGSPGLPHGQLEDRAGASCLILALQQQHLVTGLPGVIPEPPIASVQVASPVDSSARDEPGWAVAERLGMTD